MIQIVGDYGTPYMYAPMTDDVTVQRRHTDTDDDDGSRVSCSLVTLAKGFDIYDLQTRKDHPNARVIRFIVAMKPEGDVDW